MPRSTRELLTALWCGLVAIGGPAPAAAQAWEFPAALAGQVAPDAGGGAYASFGFVDVSRQGEVVFSAALSGGTAPGGLFSVAHQVIHGSRAIALVGDVVPGDPYPFPVTFAEFVGGTISARRIAFLATFAPEGAGIFLADLDTETIALLAKVGGAAPSGGVFQQLRVPSNHCGDVVFAAVTGLQRGIFRSASGTVSAVALEGDSAGYADGIFESFGDPDCNDGRVGFSAQLGFPGSPGFSLSGIFRHAGGLELVAVEEELAPDGVPYAGFSSERLGASFQRFSYSDAAGLFLSQGIGAQTPVVMARLGQTAPRTGGGVFAAFPQGPVAKSSDFGTMLVALAQVSGGTAPAGLFEMYRDYLSGVVSITAPAIVGDAAPGTAGGTYSAFSRPAGADAFNPYIGESGVIAFAADVSGGTATSGVFVLPEPSAPGARAIGVALLLVLRLRPTTARSSPRRPRS
jgi:hypothetical protein